MSLEIPIFRGVICIMYTSLLELKFSTILYTFTPYVFRNGRDCPEWYMHSLDMSSETRTAHNFIFMLYTSCESRRALKVMK